jgi:ubiquinone/menaquinone biosynthesis C-methylase UbiE
MVESRSFDPIWEEKYAAGQTVDYPWDTVVSFVFRNAPRDKPRNDIRILEIGCGTGANLWFAAREGFQVAGVDGSSSAIHKAQERFQLDGLNGDLRVADFTHLPFEDNSFDLVIDRGSLVCVGLETGKKAIHEVHRVLREKGRFFFNPYSDRHSSYPSGEVGLDGLVSDISSGTMVGVGQLCFYGRQQVASALSNFKLLSLQHIEYTEMLKPEWLVHAEWRAVAEKIR